jgi:hypothetical protein
VSPVRGIADTKEIRGLEKQFGSIERRFRGAGSGWTAGKY